MQRGEIWIASGKKGFSGKPAPFVIVQSSISIPLRESVIVCRITSHVDDAPLYRLNLPPSQDNGLEKPSSISVDKVLTLWKSSLTRKIGAVSDSEMERLDALLRFWVGI